MTDMTTKITIANGDGELVPWEQALTWATLGMDDLSPRFPLIKIATPVSRMAGAEKHGGDFWHSDREGEPDEYTNVLDIVILSRLRTRAMFEASENEPVCRSSNGVVPVLGQPLWTKTSVVIRDGNGTRETGIPHGEPARCGTCFFSMWGAGNEPPVCRESDVFLVDRGLGDLAQLRVSGKNISPIRDFLKTKVVPKHIPPFAFRLHLRTEKKVKDGNTWHEIVTIAERLPDDEASAYARLLAERHAAFMNEAEQEWDAPTASTEESPAFEWPSETTTGGTFETAFDLLMASAGVTKDDVAKYGIKKDFSYRAVEAWCQKHAQGTDALINLVLQEIDAHARQPGMPV